MADNSIVSANLADYYARPETSTPIDANEPSEPVINRHTRRHEKALLRRAAKKRIR